MLDAVLLAIVGVALVVLALALLSALVLLTHAIEATRSTLVQADAIRRIEQETTDELMQALAWYEEQVDRIVQEARASVQEGD